MTVINIILHVFREGTIMEVLIMILIHRKLNDTLKLIKDIESLKYLEL